MRLRGRLLLAFAVVIATMLGVMEIAARGWLRGNLESQMLDDMRGAATLASESLPETTAPDLRWDAIADRAGAALGDRVTFVAPDGRVLGDSEVAAADLASVENHAARPEIADAVRTGDGRARRFSATIHRDLFYVAHRAPSGVVVRVARSAAQVDEALAASRHSALVAGAIAALLAGILAFVLAEALSRPVLEIAEAARAMAGGFSRRIDVRRKDELGTLAGVLNGLAGGLARTIEEVTAERNRIAAVFAGMIEGVLVTDANARVVMVNPSLRELFGMRDEVAGRTPIEAVRSEELHRAIHEVLAGGRPGARTIEILGPPERTLDVRFSVLRGDDGAGIRGLVAVFHDVTEIRRLEHVRRDFVSNASHELKTPVAAILGASETLSGGALRDEAAGPRFVDLIARNAARLAALVEDLLDLSRLEAREGADALRSVDTAEALTRAATTHRDAAAAKRITLTVESASAGAVRGDSALLDRALTNLVQNAVRYTPEGGRVVLRGKRIADRVRIEVEDTGIGIPSNALSRIFERFYRVDPARSRELGGTGLGLAIVKHAVETMGGEVSVESTPGKGSTFAVTLAAWRD